MAAFAAAALPAAEKFDLQKKTQAAQKGDAEAQDEIGEYYADGGGGGCAPAPGPCGPGSCPRRAVLPCPQIPCLPPCGLAFPPCLWDCKKGLFSDIVEK